MQVIFANTFLILVINSNQKHTGFQLIKEGMKEAALRMLAAGKYALEEIANISGLSLEEVNQLKAERNA